MPEDPAVSSPSLNTAASKWKEEHLQMLNVEYNPHNVYPIDIPLASIPPEVKSSNNPCL